MEGFYPEPGKRSEKAEQAAQNMKSMELKLAGYGTMRYAGYTTWLVL